MAVYGGGAPLAPQRRVRIDAIGEAFNMVKDNAGTWVLASLIVFAVAFGVSFVVGLVTGGVGAATGGGGSRQPNIGATVISSLIGQVAQIVVSSFLVGGMYKMALKQVRGQAIQVGDLFSAGDIVGKLIGAMLLTALAVDAGALFCIVPGLLVAGLLMFTNLLIVDQKMGALDAMKASWETLKGDMWSALAFVLVAGLVAGLGILGCGVGILFTMPVYYVAMAIVYRDFFGEGGAFTEPTINMPLPPQFSDDERTMPMG